MKRRETGARAWQVCISLIVNTTLPKTVKEDGVPPIDVYEKLYLAFQVIPT